MNNLSITGDGYNYNHHVNDQKFIMNNIPQQNFLHQFTTGPITSGIQPPPYSVAISSNFSSSSPPPGYPLSYVSSSSSSSRPLQVPIDVQGSILQGNEFDQYQLNSRRRTSVPVSIGSNREDGNNVGNNSSDVMVKSGRRLNRPDVLGLRNVERQLSLPLESSCSVRRSTADGNNSIDRRNRRNGNDRSGLGEEEDDDDDEDEDTRGRVGTSGSGLLDDDDGDNECGDDELSEYGAYPPPEPAPPDFIPSSDHSAFLSPNIQLTSGLAVGGHTSTSSIEGIASIFLAVSSFLYSFFTPSFPLLT